MKPEMAKQLKALEKENARLKKMVYWQTLDMEILREAGKGNWQALNVANARYPRCFAAWGKLECRNVVCPAFWVNNANPPARPIASGDR